MSKLDRSRNAAEEAANEIAQSDSLYGEELSLVLKKLVDIGYRYQFEEITRVKPREELKLLIEGFVSQLKKEN